MPNPDAAWEEAQKARYIRTKDLLERDKELSVKEIFSKEQMSSDDIFHCERMGKLVRNASAEWNSGLGALIHVPMS